MLRNGASAFAAILSAILIAMLVVSWNVESPFQLLYSRGGENRVSAAYRSPQSRHLYKSSRSLSRSRRTVSAFQTKCPCIRSGNFQLASVKCLSLLQWACFTVLNLYVQVSPVDSSCPCSPSTSTGVKVAMDQARKVIDAMRSNTEPAIFPYQPDVKPAPRVASASSRPSVGSSRYGESKAR